MENVTDWSHHSGSDPARELAWYVAGMHVVYMLACPNDLRVRYVGITNNIRKRIEQHVTTLDGSMAKCRWIHGLRQQGKRPRVVVFKYCDTRDEARQIEAELIALMPGLLNSMRPKRRAH